MYLLVEENEIRVPNLKSQRETGTGERDSLSSEEECGGCRNTHFVGRESEDGYASIISFIPSQLVVRP